jgi:hypothetical protein
MSTNDARLELGKCLHYLKVKFKIQEAVDVQIVMGEWHENLGETVVREFAAKSGLHRANIGTPYEEQFRTFRGPICFPGHNGTLQSDEDASETHEYGPFENQDAREKQMVQNVRTEMTNYESGILVLGLAHMHSVFEKLQSSGFQVYGFSYYDLPGTPFLAPFCERWASNDAVWEIPRTDQP